MSPLKSPTSAKRLLGLQWPSLAPQYLSQGQKYLSLMRRMGQDEFWKRMSRVTAADRKTLHKMLWTAVWMECGENLETFAQYVMTKDEHAPPEKSSRMFPSRSEKPYIWEVLDTLQLHNLVCIEKSRQLMISWLVCLYALWMAKFKDNRLIFVQSKKEEDAANLVFNRDPLTARISYMEAKLPDELRTLDFTRASYSQLVFPTNSKIWGIPEGADKIRSYSASIVISDEAAFQPEFEDAYTAARPAITGGGQFIAISTARPGAYMMRLLEVA